MKASTCTSCTVPLQPLVGHCHLRLRCAIAKNVSRSNAASPETGWNLRNPGMASGMHSHPVDASGAIGMRFGERSEPNKRENWQLSGLGMHI